MKTKYILAALFLMLAACAAQAQLLLEENFSYTVGDTLGVPANAHGSWRRVATGASPRYGVIVASTPLTWSGYEGSGKGRSIQYPVEANSAGYLCTYALPEQKNTSLYAAFLVKVQTAPNTDVAEFISFESGTAGTGRLGGVAVRKNASGKISFGVSKKGSSMNSWSAEEFPLDSTVLLVLKYTLDGNTGNANDEASLFVSPNVGSTEEQAAAESKQIFAADNTGSDTNVKGITIKVGKKKDMLLGGLRIDSTWSDAVKWSDNAAPTLSSTTPADNATDVALNTSHITLTFSEPIKAAVGASATLSDNALQNDIVNAASFTVNGSSISIPIAVDFLKPDKIYSFTLPANAVADIAGNAYAAEINISFTTKAAENLSSENAITAFKFPLQVGASEILGDSIFVAVPFGTELTKVKPDSIGLSANARLKAGAAQISDSLNFTHVQKYVVEAEDGTARDWFVKVTMLPNDKADITSFVFVGGTVTISANDTTIRVRMADMSSLIRQPSISISANAVIVGANQAYDFSNVVTYLVTAENGINQKHWRVVVSDYGVASLPVSHKGSPAKSWQNITSDGWLSDGLANDAQDGSSGRYPAIFNTTGDRLTLRFNNAAEKITFRARSGSSGKPHKFLVEQSPDGNTWTTLREYVDEMYASSSSYNSYNLPLMLDTRCIRWTYKDKDASNGTNIYLDEVAVNVRPLKATFSPANGTKNVAANAEVKIIFEVAVASINGVAVTTHLDNVTLSRVDNGEQVATNNILSEDRKTLTLQHSGLTSAKEYAISVNGVVVGEGGVSGAFEDAIFKVAATADDVKKDILSFRINGQKEDAVINTATKTVNVTVYKDCPVKTAVKEVTHSGVSCELIWSRGGNHCPIYYRCFANDGSYADWKIAFEFAEEDNPTPINDTTGVENERHAQLQIYPNPAQHTLHISLPNAAIQQVELYNLQGTCVLQSNDSDVNVSSLQQGVYVIKIHVNNKVILSRKVIIGR